jgi:glutaminyl-peptide cyclotransferase
VRFVLLILTVLSLRRHLADKWATTYTPLNQRRRLMNVQTTELGGIEHLILLDLLGAPQPSIRSFFIDTAWLFDSLVSIEHRLGESGAFVYANDKSMAPGKWRSYFRSRTTASMNFGYIGDDHLPFLQRGVSVLHLITEPFPRVWHTIGVRVAFHPYSFPLLISNVQDDASALDLSTLRRWNIMLRVFMTEYLNLQPQDFQARSNPIPRSESELVSMMDRSDMMPF